MSAQHDHAAPPLSPVEQGLLDLVDPDHLLPEPERHRRAVAAMRLHLARLDMQEREEALARKRQGRPKKAAPVEQKVPS